MLKTILKGFQFFLILLLFMCKNSLAQYYDCNQPILVDDTLFIQQTAPLGIGKIKELAQVKPYDSVYFKSEKNSTWIQLKHAKNSEFTFQLAPHDVNDDYDFMIFDASTVGVCDSLKYAGKLKPLRANISRNDKSVFSKTGLSYNGTEKYVGIGVGNSFSSPMNLEADKEYLLVICCDKNPKKGFSLHLKYNPYNNQTAATDSIIALLEAELKSKKNKLHLIYTDEITHEPIATSLVIKTAAVDTGFVVGGLSNYTFQFKETQEIAAIAPGYMAYKKTYTPPYDSMPVFDTVKLSKVMPEMFLDINAFFFEGNTDVMLPKSQPALASLLLFLKNNPTITIEIQGHVNGPKQRNSRDFRRLSEARADAIKKFLTWQGINKKMLKVEGYGNSLMIYPEPQSELESEANRRVEIKILAVD
jgi:outer membrane protein OmpA-like peptidoglycan-associated protein